MGSFSIWHWLVVLLVVLLLFGSGKISGLMGDLATGIKSFKKNMKEEDDVSMAETAPPAPASQPTGSLSGPAGTHTSQATAAHPATPASSRPAA
jgi:sec-independent protein translocase protein TatA